MPDLLQPWVIKSALIISALVLVDVVLCMVCARLERRKGAAQERIRAKPFANRSSLHGES